jgi:hypothetical protein
MKAYLQGREDANHTTKHGATTIELLNMDEFLRILKKKSIILYQETTLKD